jgi:hypothetical protein
MSEVGTVENGVQVVAQPKLKLKLTRGQAGAVIEAVNAYVALGTGRFQVVAQLVASGLVPLRREYDGPRKIASPETCALVSGLMRDAARQLGYWEQRSNDVKHPHVCRTVRLACEAGEAIASASLLFEEGDMDARTTVVMTLEQARGLAEASEALARLGIGQLEYVEELVRMGVVPVYRDASEERELAAQSVLERIASVMAAVKHELGFHTNGSNGIGHPHNSLNVTRSWEVHKVIRQALALYRDPKPEFSSVDYDGVGVLRWNTDPAPVATIDG